VRATQPPHALAKVRGDVAWPDALQRVFDVVLARDRDERYPTAGAFARALSEAIEKWQVEKEKGRLIDVLGRRRRIVVSASAVLLGAVVGMSALAFERSRAIDGSVDGTGLVVDTIGQVDSGLVTPSPDTRSLPSIKGGPDSAPGDGPTDPPARDSARGRTEGRKATETSPMAGDERRAGSTAGKGSARGSRSPDSAVATASTAPTDTSTGGEGGAVDALPSKVSTSARLSRIDRLLHPDVMTQESAQRALDSLRALRPDLSTPSEIVSFKHYQARAYLGLGRNAEACAIVEDLLPGASPGTREKFEYLAEIAECR